LGRTGLLVIIVILSVLLVGVFVVLYAHMMGLETPFDALGRAIGNAIAGALNIQVNVPEDGGSTTVVVQQGEDKKAPTSMTAFVSPNPVTMGDWIKGTVTSDGYNYPITIHALHIGENAKQSFAGVLDDQGKYELINQLNTPGYWQFWVETDVGVKSNKVQLTCQGIKIVGDKTVYDKSQDDQITFKVYSHYTGDAQVVAEDPNQAVSIPVTTVTINSGGYATFTVNLDSWSDGDYRFNVLIGGEKATDYGGEFWVKVQA